MNKNLQSRLKIYKIYSVFLTLFFLLLFNISSALAQVSVSGRVTSSRFPVQNALLTFIDNEDSTRQFSAVTDKTGNFQISVITSVISDAGNLPENFSLGQNYPNPFSSNTAIPYGLNKESDVKVTIFDILGRVVKKINAGVQSGGSYNILWDGRNNSGQKIANGIYFYKLEVNGESQVKKMIFNQSEKGSISLPNLHSSRGNSFSTKINKYENIAGNSFKVRIENTNTTAPLVVPVEIENVTLQNDTTINFTVSSNPVANIYLDSLKQIIRGFGAANILPWRPDMNDSEIQTAFGTGEGELGFTILRLMIQPDSNQWSMNVSTAKKAYDMGAIVFASPWNAPSNMSEVVDGQTRIRYDMYDEYAEHLNSFNTYMENNDVPMYAISVQNEPDYAEDWTGWTSGEMLTFMRENAHTIETNVMAPESFQFRRNMSDPILNDSVANSNLDIVGGHIYGGGLASYPLAEQKGKEIWMTEHLTGEDSHSNDWNWAFQVAEEMNDVMEAGMSAYVWWYIVRYYGPISDGEKENEGGGRKGEVTKKGYVMSQFAKFIRPGYYRVESQVSPPLSDVKVTAYKDSESSKIIIVAVNSGSTEQEQLIRIQNMDMTTNFTPYTTSETQNVEQGDDIIITDGNLLFTLEPSSITTFVSN